jgi:hypothetical protein
VVSPGDMVAPVTEDILEWQQGLCVNPKRGLLAAFPFAPHFVLDHLGVAAADLCRRKPLEVPGIDTLHKGGDFFAVTVGDYAWSERLVHRMAAS